MRIVHYVNQFFAGIGGEEAAGEPPGATDGALGPGKRLDALLGEEHQIVATVHCGDDYGASTEGATEEIVALAQEAGAEMVVAGPAFTSGRYGFVAASVARLAAEEGLVAVCAMHPDNPGAEAAGSAPVVESAATAREMKRSLDLLGPAVRKAASGEILGREDGRVGKIPRRNVRAGAPAAERAVDLVLARLAGDREATEVPLPRFDRVTPAAPLERASEALVALLTEGALVPRGNPDRLPSSRATKWLRYRIEEERSVPPGEFESVHGGFSTQAANDDPHRMLPLDVARELEDEGSIGGVHGEYLVTVGNGTQVVAARRFGVEWAAELRKAGVQAAILTAT